MYSKEQMKEGMKFAALIAKNRGVFDLAIFDEEIERFINGIAPMIEFIKQIDNKK